MRSITPTNKLSVLVLCTFSFVGASGELAFAQGLRKTGGGVDIGSFEGRAGPTKGKSGMTGFHIGENENPRPQDRKMNRGKSGKVKKQGSSGGLR